MFEEILRHRSPAALILIVLVWLMLGVGHHFLLQSHYRRRGIPSNWQLRPRSRGLGDIYFFHFNAKEWLIEVPLMLATSVLLMVICVQVNYLIHLVF
jgi:hypothetical protein